MVANQLIKTGLKYLGTPYVFNAPPYRTDMFDCSSFIQFIFAKNGIYLPRNSRQQALIGQRISSKHLKKGDLLFFTTKRRANKSGLSKIGHVGIYMGNGNMLHTFRPENKVTITKLDSEWSAKFLLAKRII